MGKPIERQFTQEKTILKYFESGGKKAIVIDDTTSYQTINDRKIVKAGTPYPANDATCEGVIFQDVDVTDGAAPATLCFNAPIVIDLEKVAENGITISDEAKLSTNHNLLFE